ncbi:uncharacterized protein [Palaemon carinicauda]|uniref:uncharacterized protein n=1 Tax=Palaemon carinicauda TaxID=392227 RepID=UPI0035B60769
MYCPLPPTIELACILYDKHTFTDNKVLFLGHHITPEGVHTNTEMVVAIPNFLGMINNHHRFLSAFNATIASHYAFLKGKPKDLKWCLFQVKAFCNAKNSLSTAAALTLLMPHALALSTNASDVASCAIYNTRPGGHQHTPPIGLLQLKTI